MFSRWRPLGREKSERGFNPIENGYFAHFGHCISVYDLTDRQSSPVPCTTKKSQLSDTLQLSRTFNIWGYRFREHCTLYHSKFLCLIIQSIWHTLCLSYTVSSHPMKVARFHSTHKTIEILQSPCSNSPCLNGGTCVALYDKHDFMCACPTGFVGKTCEKEGKTKKETTSLKHPCAPICWWPRHG